MKSPILFTTSLIALILHSRIQEYLYKKHNGDLDHKAIMKINIKYTSILILVYIVAFLLDLIIFNI